MAIRINPSGWFFRRLFWPLFLGIWLIAGVGFLISGISMWREEGRFAIEAVTTEGKVLTRDIRTARRSSGGTSSTSTEYWISYRFQSADGRRLEGSSKVDVHLWESLQEQGPVSVSYLANDPATNRVAGETEWLEAGIITGVGAVISLVVSVVIIVMIGNSLSRARLLRNGLLADGIVTAVEQTNFSINRVPQWIVRYRYNDHRGRTYEGKSPYLSPEEAGGWKEGDNGKVRYDREKSDKNVWIGRDLGRE